MIFLQLCYTFFKIGLFGFGGGYAMLSLIEHEVVHRYGWLSAARFADLIAISQMTPGAISINCATYVGYEAVLQAGYPVFVAVLGSILTSLALCAPSLALMILVLKFLFDPQRRARLPYLQPVLDGLKPAVVGLIFSSALLLLNPQNFIDWRSGLICIVALAAVLSKKISPVYLILLSGLAGYLLY